jgi:hypothetical protein
MTSRFLLLCLLSVFLSFTEFSVGQVVDTKIKYVHAMYKPEKYTINTIDTNSHLAALSRSVGLAFAPAPKTDL